MDGRTETLEVSGLFLGDRPHAEHGLPGRPVGTGAERLRQMDEADAD